VRKITADANFILTAPTIITVSTEPPSRLLTFAAVFSSYKWIILLSALLTTGMIVTLVWRSHHRDRRI